MMDSCSALEADLVWTEAEPLPALVEVSVEAQIQDMEDHNPQDACKTEIVSRLATLQLERISEQS